MCVVVVLLSSQECLQTLICLSVDNGLSSQVCVRLTREPPWRLCVCHVCMCVALFSADCGDRHAHHHEGCAALHGRRRLPVDRVPVAGAPCVCGIEPANHRSTQRYPGAALRVCAVCYGFHTPAASIRLVCTCAQAIITAIGNHPTSTQLMVRSIQTIDNIAMANQEHAALVIDVRSLLVCRLHVRGGQVECAVFASCYRKGAVN